MREKEMTAEQIHNWYLEATRILHPESYNAKAQKPYSELTEEQQIIDKYILNKFMQWHNEECKKFALRCVPGECNFNFYTLHFIRTCREQMIKNIEEE